VQQTKANLFRRAGGRRRYNAERQAEARARRAAIVAMLGDTIILNPRGVQTLLANYFGVNRSTICRDVEALRVEYRRAFICPLCGTWWNVPLRVRARYSRSQGAEFDCCADFYQVREATTSKRQKRKRVLTY
jgi:hypothetical protein